MLSDLLAAIAVSLLVAAGCVLAVGYLSQPTFEDRCVYCGEYLEDAPAAHEHLRRCGPCR